MKKIIPLFLQLLNAIALSVGMFGCAFLPTPPEKELLIYCGVTMIKPMTEIAEMIEAQENIDVIIIKGGSGNLLRSIEINGVGDLYLPGDEVYIKNAAEKGLGSV